MVSDSSDWVVPAPLRALLWWPGVAFVLVLVSPDAAAGSIAVAGVVLVAVGALLGAVGRRWRRVPAEPSAVDGRPVSRVA